MWTKYRELGKRLWAEFWFPLFCAMLWTLYSVGNAWSIKLVISNFCSSFVLVSWVSGQIFRIAKQNKVEKNLGTIETRINGLVDRLELHARDFMGYSVGENGFAYFQPMIFVGTNRVELRLLNDSEYPVFDVISELIDLDEKIYPEQGKLWTRHKSFMMSLYPKKISDPLYAFDMQDREWLRVNVFIQTRSGGCVQQFRVCRVSGDQILIASVTDKPGGPQFNIPSNFPEYEVGKEKELFQ